MLVAIVASRVGIMLAWRVLRSAPNTLWPTLEAAFVGNSAEQNGAPHA